LQNDPDAREFAQWLLEIGHGKHTDKNCKVEIPYDMQSNDIESLMNFIYPHVDSSPSPPPEYFLNRMILAPCNTDVNDVNNKLLDHMHGDDTIYHSADQVIHEEGADGHDYSPMTTEFFWSINSSSLPPGELRIKKGCPLILMWNLSPSNGLCNGSCMVVVRMSEHVLEVQLIGGEHNGELALIPCISLIPTLTTDFTFKCRQQQFPIRFAFAITINHAQGQSVKHVGIDLCFPVFAHGQLYVALSCVTAKQNVKVLLPHDNLDSKMINIVYQEALLDKGGFQWVSVRVSACSAGSKTN